MNKGSLLPEEDFASLSDDLFDEFIKSIDFPLEDVEYADDEGEWDAGFQDLEPPPMDMFPCLSSEFACGSFSKGGHVGGQKTLPVLKQSSSLEASSNIRSSVHKSSPDIKVLKLFQSSSPVSVLENSNCSLSSENSRSHRLVFPVKGIRSKRKRPTTLKLRLLSFEPRKSQPSISDDSESETYCPYEKPTKKKRKKHSIHLTHSSSFFLEAKSLEGTTRKCTHCETTKTPQWREGPNGPKTLCNACGVRYRSGRLVPEYRPAASPTFTPSLHSNSHRKIIEMRRNSGEQFDTGVIHALISRA